jgi:hypothetical protein
MFPQNTNQQETIEIFTGLKKADFVALNAQIKNILEILKVVLYVLIGFMIVRAIK